MSRPTSPLVTNIDSLVKVSKLMPKAGQGGEHAIQGRVGRLLAKASKHVLVAMFTGMDHAANFLLDGFFVGPLLANHLGRLVPADTLVVSLSFPFRIERVSAL